MVQECRIHTLVPRYQRMIPPPEPREAPFTIVVPILKVSYQPEESIAMKFSIQKFPVKDSSWQVTKLQRGCHHSNRCYFFPPVNSVAVY